MNCKYCQPSNHGFLDDLGNNLLNDNEEIHIGINTEGRLEISLDIETTEWDDYYDGFASLKRETSVKINYCPMCGRKLSC